MLNLSLENKMYYYPYSQELIDFDCISEKELETLLEDLTASMIILDSRIARYAEEDDPEKLSLERKWRWQENTRKKCGRVLYSMTRKRKQEEIEDLALLRGSEEIAQLKAVVKARNIEIAEMQVEAKSLRMQLKQKPSIDQKTEVEPKKKTTERTPQQILEKKYAHEIHVRADLFRKAASQILDEDNFQKVLEKYEQMLVDFDAGLGPHS
jgi:regulator of replication initiation timing